MSDNLVVLTRDNSGNAAWRPQLERHGLSIYELPCIETAAAEPTPEIEQAFDHIKNFSWLIFTSPTGVRYFLELAATMGLPLRSIAGTWIAAVGLQTADALRSLGLPVTFVPSRQTAATLARELKKVKSRHILFLRTGIGAGEPVEILRSRSAKVTDLAVYQTIPLTDPDPGFNQLMRDGDIGRLIFASPSAVHGFTRRVSDPVVLELALETPAVAIGPTTASAASESGFRRLHTAQKPSVSAIMELLS